MSYAVNLQTREIQKDQFLQKEGPTSEEQMKEPKECFQIIDKAYKYPTWF
jgi:hypothetical protein